MRTLSLVTKLTLLAAIGTGLLTGCSSTSSDRYTGGPAQSTIAYNVITDPAILTSWQHQTLPISTGWSLRVIESIPMVVPADVAPADVENLPAFSVNLAPGTVFVEAAGGGEPVARRLIVHRPQQR